MRSAHLLCTFGKGEADLSDLSDLAWSGSTEAWRSLENGDSPGFEASEHSDTVLKQKNHT